ncbi:MAG: hypothetical protein V7607_2911, partial [Solirubrobacteraceae bacterium]
MTGVAEAALDLYGATLRQRGALLLR